MRKYCFLTDPHVRSTNPISRRGNYANDILEKIAWVLNKARTENCDGVLCGGDLLDNPAIGIEVFFRLCQLIQDYGRPFYLTYGNHDVYGATVDTVRNSLIGFLPHFVGNVRSEPQIALDSGLELYQYHYRTALDSNLRLEQPDRSSVHVVHAMVTAEPFIGHYTLVDQVGRPAVDDNYHLVLCGHYHPGFRTTSFENTLFVAPGALGRGSKAWSDLSRKPKCVIFEWPGPNQPFIVTEHDVPHVPAEEAFDLRQAKRLQEEAQTLTEFVASLTEHTVQQGTMFSVESYLDVVEREQNVDPDVIKELRLRLAAVG
jgi:DNA repair exonuclease SbcCD nuclease subunit